ncbi:deoxyguanosinetriphosphate triphosphohydrolase [Sandaracinobacteroides hominis]|uniref:deoxyguanosinetriphosphate triphosphohydrolase n=1 Tax=Sandaracinobacteroides hominis TaxID=2780086 RepID=UPI0018F50DA2|nr:deoxyguanosinetriphosphate triphosphohydrolase [Sandaracinobacteroides hominis]
MAARFATDPAQSRGRFHAEPESPLRTAFARDRDRLIHSTAFRRLRYKTQVFVAPDGDHFRVRLTHSLEVAQIARSIARVLELDEDLAEVVALAHDLGHPPFGHSGEDALGRAMHPYGGFDHNGHAIRIVTLLESRTPAYDGLNLSWEVLEGLAKHNGPVANPGWALSTHEALWPLELFSWPGLEAQVAALSDDIAYNAHDLDDGLRAGLLDLDEVCAAVPLVDAIWRDVKARWPNEQRKRALRPQLIRDLIGVLVESLLSETRRLLAEAAPQSADEVRMSGRALVGFTPATLAEIAPLRSHLMQAMYTHPSVKQLRQPAEQVVEQLFLALEARPGELPERWRERLANEGDDSIWRGRTIGDYVAGMTDRFAIREHRRLTGACPMPDEFIF